MCRSLLGGILMKTKQRLSQFLSKRNILKKPTTSKLNQSDDKVPNITEMLSYNLNVLPEKEKLLCLWSLIWFLSFIPFGITKKQTTKQTNFHKMQLKKNCPTLLLIASLLRRCHLYPFECRDYYWTEILDEFAAMASKLFLYLLQPQLDWWFFSTKTYSGLESWITVK